MINMPIADIMMLITGEVEKPAAPVAGDGMADASFLSFIAGDETGFEQLTGGPDMMPDSSVGHSNNNVDTPVAKVTLLSGMMDQQVAIMPADRSLILSDAESVLNAPPEKMTDAVQPDLRVGSLKMSEKTSVGAPALQDTDAAQDVLRQTKEASSVLPQMVASDKQTNAAISATIPNDAPKQVRQPATLATPQKDGGAFQHDVMPKTAAWPRPQMPVSTDPDVVPAHRANTVIQTVAETTQKAGAMVNEITPGKRLGHAPGEATETKEAHRGQPMPIPQAPLASHLPNVDLPVTTRRPTVEFPAPHPVNTAKELAPANTEMLKVQNPLRQNTPNRPASDMPNRIEPPQIQTTTTAPLQINLPSAAHPFAPLQPTVAVPQSPKRQTSEGQLPEPDVQPAKQTTADAPFQTTTPAAPPPLTPMADPAVAEGMRPELTPELIPLETRTADSTTITRHDTITNRPEVARHIAQQLAEVARQMPDRPVELTLNPDELGRVRLTFTMSDGGIHVAVLAERGETMDLLRRHIETLAQEFRNMGYKDVNFDFSRNGQGNSGNTDSNPEDPEGQTQTPTETQTLTPVQLSLEPSTGLDLRL